MQLDIYCRPEADHKRSYLAVPAGRRIPPEAINTDWQHHARQVELDESTACFDEFGIEAPARQLREKGYAITSVALQVEASE